MPKPPPRYNPRHVTAAGSPSSRVKKPIGIKDLLGRSAPLQQAIARQADRGTFWRGFFAARLAPDLAGQITQIVEREGALTVYAQSAAWSARLRFAMAELWGEAQAASPGLTRCSVKVQPVAARTGART